jgi:hypothetical protein
MSNKHLLVISKNYWGANKAEDTALLFIEKFVDIVKIHNENITTLIGNNVTLQNVKQTIFDKVSKISNLMTTDDNKYILYIYMNGHGNQITDTNGDEMSNIVDGETFKDANDEIYQLPDGILVDDELTFIINKASKNNSNKKLFVVLISDHCSSGSMLDNNMELNFDYVTYGSSYDNEDSYMTGDGNVMTINFLSVLDKCKTFINECTSMSFFRLLDREMKESFIGDMQKVTIHVSDPKIFLNCIF